MKTFARWLFKPDIHEPIFIEGLPGFGNIGRLTAKLLVDFCGGKRFLELYSPYFPDYVIVNGHGVCRPPRYEFYSASTQDKDLIILTGDTQPSIEDVNAHYELGGEILDIAEKFGCNTIITIGGVPVQNPNKEIFVASTSPRLALELTERGALLYSRGKIMGATGILLGLAKVRGWTGICLLGATSGLKADREAALSVFRFLLKILGLEEKKGL
ncbi:MAG TPA: proteasome assembly chaperone family protein [Candidatus Bathyarchaeota archaeon]|nr:proteasome assembly chaperone family protein [Candidatus Bathyarchaeota archaeon]